MYARKIAEAPGVEPETLPSESFYSASRQPNAISIRQIIGLNSFKNHPDGICAGHYNGSCWELTGSTITQYTGPISPSLEKLNPANSPDHMIAAGRAILNEVLKLGLLRADLDFIRWSQKTFTGQSINDEQLTGRLTFDSKGRVFELFYSTIAMADEYWIQYFYPSSPQEGWPTGLPNRFAIARTFHGPPRQTQPIVQYEIHRLKITSKPLPENTFSPEPFLTPQMASLVFTNGGIYQLDGSSLQPLESSGEPLNARSHKNRRWLAAAFVSFSFVSFLAFLLFWKKSEQ